MREISRSRRTSPNLFPVPSKQRIKFRGFGVAMAVDMVFVDEGLLGDVAIGRDGDEREKDPVKEGEWS